MKIKFKIIIGLALIVVLVSAFVINTYASNDIDNNGSNTSDNQNSVESLDTSITESAFGNFQNENLVGTQRNLELDKSIITLTYSYSMNANDIAVTERNDVYGTQDIFVDEDGREYYYLYNTNKFLGFFEYPDISGEYQSSIKFKVSGIDYVDEKNVVNIATEYLSDKIDNFDYYIYGETEFQTISNTYDVRFYYYLNGIKTDEVARFWITPNGEIIGAYCFDMSKYSRYQGKELTLQSNTTTAYSALNDEIRVEEYVQTAKEQNIEESYITTDNNGKLYLFTFSCDDAPEGHKEEMIPISIE